jgi:hypothetical protein
LPVTPSAKKVILFFAVAVAVVSVVSMFVCLVCLFV